MTYIEMIEAQGIAVIRPSGFVGLSSTDFERLTSEVDDYLSDHDALRELQYKQSTENP